MRRRLSPPQLLAVSLGGLIVLGTILLFLPVSTEAGSDLSLLDALFTATSAVCVTGLIVVDTPGTFTTFGEAVVLALIQLGGLGYMTISTIVITALGRGTTLQERLALQEALNVDSLGGVVRFARNVFKLTVVLELAGFVVLTLWWAREMDLAEAAWKGLFHAVSAFNNAGFSLFSDNLMRFRGDVVVNLVIGGLIVCGSVGFLVLVEVGGLRGGVERSTHTRFVLWLTPLLIAGGAGAFLVLERDNPQTLGGLPGGTQLLAALFQSVTARTAGFNTLDIAALTPPSQFVLTALMFIGGAPGGTAGGVKVSTFGITVLALWATIRGRVEPTLFNRRIGSDLVAKAFFVSLIAFLALNVVSGLLLTVEKRDLLSTLFEATSAFGTVGLSMSADSTVSLSASFSTAGRILIVAMMFVGRMGPLTLAVALARGRHPAHLRYPEGKILIG